MPASQYTDDDSELSYSTEDEEWDESVRQLQQLVSFVVLPLFGRFMGRKWSHWAYNRYLQYGLSKAFFLGQANLNP